MAYKSKHTGAQVDEAVSKVLNGEVGGGGATPDWNAQQGEAGYIENRTHYTEKVNGELFQVTEDIYDVHYQINQSDNELDETFYLRVFYAIDDTNILFNKVYKSSNIHNELYNGLELGTIDTPLGKLYIFVYINSDNTYTIVVANADGGYFDKEGIINDFIVEKIYVLDEKYIPDTIARKSDIPVPIIINYNTIKDAANSEVNTISEQTWLKYIANNTYKNYDWIIQRDGIKYNCTVIPDYDNKHIQILYFTRNEIEGTSGPLGNAIMKYSGLRIQLLPYTKNTYLIYKISNGGSLETREFVFGENYNNNAYLIAAAQMSGIDTIDCKWVYTKKADDNITVNGQDFHIENSITNVDAIFSVKDKSLTYVDGNGLINKVTFADNGSYNISKNNPDIPDTVVKTTPQTLSNNAKNQALANLGIERINSLLLPNKIGLTEGVSPNEEIAQFTIESSLSQNIPYLEVNKNLILTNNLYYNESIAAKISNRPNSLSGDGKTYAALEVDGRDVAIKAENGQFAGLRPRYRRITSSDILSKYDHTIECIRTDGGQINLTLPANPEKGQCYEIWKWGDCAISIRGNGKDIIRIGISELENQGVGVEWVGIIKLVYRGNETNINNWLMTLHRTE